jgi:RNA polymerase sigma factor (TIGR02999 family)
MESHGGEVSRVLAELRAGQGGNERLVSLLYSDLHRLASSCMRRERAGHTLQTTAVVHEAFLRLVGADACWEDRAQFFAAAARVMRQVLIDYARRRHAARRGSAAVASRSMRHCSFARTVSMTLALGRALEKLECVDPRQKQLVEMRFFAGLSIEEIARCLRVSEPTVKREWRSARAWLHARSIAGRS